MGINDGDTADGEALLLSVGLVFFYTHHRSPTAELQGQTRPQACPRAHEQSSSQVISRTAEMKGGKKQKNKRKLSTSSGCGI